MIYDCIIIGKGPAGISAGLYAKRAGLNILIIGKDGGALEKTEKIDNYYGFSNTISGKELLQEGLRQAERLKIELLTDEVIGISFEDNYKVKTRNGIFNSKSVILATGTNRKEPKIKNVKEYEGKGVSYCAVCDSFFYRDKDVSVLGSGDYALEEAKELLPIANKVTILTNGEELTNNTRGYKDIEVDERKVEEIRGNNTVEEIKFSDDSVLKVDGVFIAIGTASSTDLARKLGAIVNDKNIEVNEKMQTNVPGLYACGDCTGGLLQISKAVYEGAVAGLEVNKYIKEIKGGK